MIFRDSQAPLKIRTSSPVTPDLLLDSRPERQVKSHAEDPLEISSLNETLTKKPMTFQGTLNHAPVKILIDSGAMGNFVSQQAADRFSFALSHVSNIPVVFANGATGNCNKAALAAYLRFNNHEERIDLRVVSLPHHDIILGQPWLEKWNPEINWRDHEISFVTSNLDPPVMVTKSQEPTPITFISASHLIQSTTEDDQVYLCMVTEEGDINYTNANDSRIQPLLQEFPDVFPKELPPGLPPSRDIDHRIILEPGNTPPWWPIYRMSPLELDTMRIELD